MNILITGAKGNLGSYTIDYIKKYNPNASLYGLARSERNANLLKEKGVTPLLGDYNDINSLVNAFTNMDRLLFISIPDYNLQKNVVEAAQLTNIKYIAYTSVSQIDHSQFGLEINHKATEKLIKESNIPHTFLRNTWYLDMMKKMIQIAYQTGQFPYYANDQKISFALRKDLAKAAAKIITSENNKEVIELSNNSFTYEEFGKAIEKATNKKINVYKANRDEFIYWMQSNGATSFDIMLASSYQDYALNGNNGQENLTSKQFEETLK